MIRNMPGMFRIMPGSFRAEKKVGTKNFATTKSAFPPLGDGETLEADMRRRQSPDVLIWHVFSRGTRRMALFYEEQDYREFLQFLKEALILSGCALFAFALMGNHYHLMLRGSQAQLTRCMQRLNWRYALYHNDLHMLGGHVFDGPYQEYPQRSLKWLLWRLAYIFLNPVKAGLAERPEDYPWSGYSSFLGKEGSPLEVSPLPDLAREGYPLSELRETVLSFLEEQNQHGEARGGATPTAADIQMDQFAWVLRQAEARAKGIPGLAPDSLAMWWGRQMGVPPRLMARALHVPSADMVRTKIRRFGKMLESDEDLAKRLIL